MKYIVVFLLLYLFTTSAIAQKIRSRVSLTAIDGKTYIGTITEIQEDKYKIKYDGVDFDAWLLSSQFKVIDIPNPPDNNRVPAEQTEPVTAAPVIPEQAQRFTMESPKTKSDSLKMAIANVKNAFDAASKLFISKRDTITIVIPDIDYDNINLLLLKEHIKKVKGVRSVEMNYNSSTAKLEVAFRGKPTDLWDNIHADVRMKFKLIEAGENNITLNHK